jgi:hypothetical protein
VIIESGRNEFVRTGIPINFRRQIGADGDVCAYLAAARHEIWPVAVGLILARRSRG